MKKKIYILILLFVCFSFSIAFSQSNQTKFQIIYNWSTSSSNNGFLFGQTTKNSPNGYITMGWGTQLGTIPPGPWGVIFEIDTMGNPLWAKRYKGDNGFFPTTPLMFNDFVKSGTNYLITGERNTSAMLMKLNSTGSAASFSSSYSGNSWGNKLKEDGSGNIIVAGATQLKTINPDKDSTSIYIFKTNSGGAFSWGRSYTLTSPIFDSHDQAMDVAVTPTEYVFTGYHSENNGADTTRNILLFKTDLNGNLKWMKSYGTLGKNEEGHNILYDAANNQYVIMGFTDAASTFGDICLMRTDTSGAILSSTAYGTSAGIAQSSTLVNTSDGGFAIEGWAAIVLASYKPFIVKLNSNFSHQWTKYYNPTITGGFFVGGEEAATHGYILSTMTADGTYGGWASELVKTDSQGKTDNTNTSCSETNYTPAQRTYAPPVKTMTPTVRNGGSASGFTPNISSFTPATTTVCMICSKPAANILSSTATAICSGSSVTLTASGGGTYSWSTGALTASINVNPTSTTTYYCAVTVNSCDSVVPYTVTVNPAPGFSITGNNSICQGQTTTLSASGGGTYLWNTTATTSSIIVSPTTSTGYSVVVIGANGCTSSSSNTVSVNSAPTASVSGTPSVCKGDAATLNAFGGTSYLWSTGSTATTITDSPTTNTTYTVTVSNGSCSSTATATVVVNSLPVAAISGNTNLCIGQTTTLTASGGGTYLWNTTATTTSIVANPTAGTTYTVTVTNASGCSDTATATVNVAAPPVAAVFGNNTICAGQSTSLSASGGLTYSWNTTATTSSIVVSPTNSTTYSVIVSSGNCSSNTSIAVTVNPKPIAIINTASTSLCIGQSATLTAVGGGTYSWSTGATINPIVVSPTSAAAYSVFVSNGMCSDTAVKNISVSPPVTAVISGSAATICSGKNATLTASGGTAYLWSNGGTTSSIVVSPPSSANYTVNVSSGSCSDTATTLVTVKPSPTAAISGNTTLCSGQNTTLTGIGSGTYLWTPGGTSNPITVSPTTTTSYSVLVTAANGCTASSAATVSVTPTPVATMSANSTICSGETILLAAAGGTTYSWIPGSQTSSSILISPSATTNYTVFVSNGNCMASAATGITVHPSPTANAGANVVIDYGSNATLTGSGGGNYSWSTGGTTATIAVSPTASTTYTLIVTDANGCTDAAVVTVTVEFSCGDIFIPNAFSPNGDNRNDMLYVRNKCLKSMHFIIYDRWGNRAFETEDITAGWDGTYHEKKQDSGVFFYDLKYELLNGNSGNKKGTITLLR